MLLMIRTVLALSLVLQTCSATPVVVPSTSTEIGAKPTLQDPGCAIVDCQLPAHGYYATKGNGWDCWQECVGDDGADADYCEEICWNYRNNCVGDDLSTLTGQSGLKYTHSSRFFDRNKCLEDCMEDEGADADYCEEICSDTHLQKYPLPKAQLDIQNTAELVFQEGRDRTDEEQACWEDCTGNEGVDSDYCEEICKDHDHKDDPDNENGPKLAKKKSQSVIQDGDGDDEKACLDDCMGNEGADSDYCEEICRNHNHHDHEDNGDDVEESTVKSRLALQFDGDDNCANPE
ncbi:hypothetical protein NP233_g8764 [Leucocoprinus birnbaumii]|uniref:Uncharacterized protein n=1 Tax=Leucocoprinus birnbaumii TaxID=56174 RepID=A0AAD5VQ74_9AGAR|nr:hypothetical protein NP233_g8764 [Leucocoprinus birnbaumii]